MAVSRRRVVGSTLGVLMLCAGLTACTIDREGDAAMAAAAQTEQEKLPPVASVTDGATDVNPAEPVTVKAVDGTLTEVTMVNQDGKEVEAEMSADHMSWTTAEPLGYYRTYTITAKTSEGKTLETSFSTAQPAAAIDAYMSPLPDSTVGIGQVVSINFSAAVPDRKAAQDAITITTDPPVDGAFFWLNNHLLRWRPKDFWEPGTKVSVKADIYGKNFGDGVWGNDNNETNFTIGDSVIAIADDNTKMLTISRGGQEEMSMPISMGRDKYATPSGTYVIGDRYADLVMDSSTYGLATDAPDGYRTDVKWATQMSWSGIYVHSAPWSVWAQGSQNTSHGCLNVSPQNAQWFFNNTKRGDVVIVRNTKGGVLNGFDGLGDWNIPWETWSAGNAEQ